MPLLASRDVLLVVRGGLCGGCVQSSMLHGGGTWPVGGGCGGASAGGDVGGRVDWMCDIGLGDRFPGGELGETGCG